MLKSPTSLRLAGRARLTYVRMVYEGITIRTWYTFGLPVEVSLRWTAMTPEFFYGPADSRPPGLWKRLVGAAIGRSGRDFLAYCPDLPPVWTGCSVSVLRHSLSLGVATFRTAERVVTHLRAQCEACTAAGWREDENTL